MTDHYSPIELSWEWGIEDKSPTVRFSIEPIGPYAGTERDPTNQYATITHIEHYQKLLPSCDLTLFDHFCKQLISFSSAQGQREHHASRTAVAFDLKLDSMMLKAYFFPIFKARDMSLSSWRTVKLAFSSMPGYSRTEYPAFAALETFLATTLEGSRLTTEIFAIDCIKQEKSRFKIYMRTRSTTFQSARVIMTLGRRLYDHDTSVSLQRLKELWGLVLSLGADFQESQDLQYKSHETAGILYYFDIERGEALPGVKVYIPVRHYGQGDQAVVIGLQGYLERYGRAAFVASYLEALQRIDSASSIKRQVALQTYVGCSLLSGNLKLTSYLSPQAYFL